MMRARCLGFLLASSLILTACGGGAGGGDSSRTSAFVGLSTTPSDCSLASQSEWLIDWMRDWYFWYQFIPSSVNALSSQISTEEAMRTHFTGLLFKGTAEASADRWSYVEASQSVQQYYDQGMQTGYGISVAGQLDDPLPLRVRWVEPLSNAALQGIQRGDVVLSMQGKPAEVWKRANDFSPLLAQSTGDRLLIEIKNQGGVRQLDLSASTYPVTSVLGPFLETQPLQGAERPLAYLFLKDFIDAGIDPLTKALESVSRNGARDLILDLRYHGGGRVERATQLASAIAPKTLRGEVFSKLVYNDKHAKANTDERFLDPKPLPEIDIERLVVITGPRTCSASEMFIHGLKARHPSLQVISIGSKTCGKPYGFHPLSACGLSYQAVNFVVQNDKGKPSEVNGMVPDCVAVDDYQSPFGSEADPLMSTARHWLRFGKCPTPQFALDSAAKGANERTRLIKDGDATQSMFK